MLPAVDRLVIREPAYVDLDVSGSTLESCRAFLTFKDRQVSYLISRHKQNRRWKSSDPEVWQARLEELKATEMRCLLLPDAAEQRFQTYSGLVPDLLMHLSEKASVENEVVYTPGRSIAWGKVPEHKLRPYQEEAIAALLEAKHGAVSLPTGSGKSRVIMEICKELGLQTVIMAPTKSIAGQLYRDFVKHFGKRHVGMYGDGKKELGKLFTVGIAASLTRVEEESSAWDDLSLADVFIADESHMCPAATLERVCMGLFAKAAYRFFVSATQVRNDGSEMVLKGITGPVVYSKTLRELVDAGFLAKPLFKMLVVKSSDPYTSDDPMKMTRHHVYQNPLVYRRAAEVINGVVKMGHRVLVLVDEISQFPMLIPHLRSPCRVAHGGVTKENRQHLPSEYHESSPNDLVERFDRGEFPILLGTGVISMGTDVKSPKTVVFLRAGASIIDIPQSVGRGTRLFTFPDGSKKTQFNFIDVMVKLPGDEEFDRGEARSCSAVYRHAISRAGMYEDLYPGTLKWM